MAINPALSLSSISASVNPEVGENEVESVPTTPADECKDDKRSEFSSSKGMSFRTVAVMQVKEKDDKTPTARKMSDAVRQLTKIADDGPTSLADKVQRMKDQHKGTPVTRKANSRKFDEDGKDAKSPVGHSDSYFEEPLQEVVWESSKYCIHPEGKLYFRWNICLTLCLLYISIAVPLQMGFRLEAEPWSAWKVFEVMFDTFFICDFALNFWHGFLDADGHLIMTQPACGKHYMSGGWIWIDGFTSIPYDWFAGGSNANKVTALKVLKSFKAAKILRLNRLLRGSLLDLVEDIIATDGTVRFTLKMVKLTLGMGFVLHVMACVWHYVTDPELSDNWVRGYLGSDEDFIDYYKIDAESPKDPDWSTDTWPLGPRYLAAVYWSTMTLSTVGYGDVLPRSNSERLMAIAGMVVGGGVYGIVLGNLVSIVTDVDTNTRAYHDRMGAIISYMVQRGFPPVLQRKIKRFYRRYFKSKSALDEKTILAELPNKLKTESSMFLVSDLVFKLEIFADLEQSHLPQLTELITPVFYDEGEMVLICGDDMRDIHIMSSGEASLFSSKGKFITEVERGHSFGHEALVAPMNASVSHWPYSVVASSNVEVLTIPVMTLLAAFDGDVIVQRMVDRAKNIKPWEEHAAPQSEEEEAKEEEQRRLSAIGEAPLVMTDLDVATGHALGSRRGSAEEGDESDQIELVSAPAPPPPATSPSVTGDVRLLKAQDKFQLEKKSSREGGGLKGMLRSAAHAVEGLDASVFKDDLSSHHLQLSTAMSKKHDETREMIDAISSRLAILEAHHERTHVLLKAIYERDMHH